MKIPRSTGRFLSDVRGLTSVEYVIVLAMIAVVSVGLWRSFGARIHDYLDKSNTKIDGQMKSVLQ